MNIDSINNGIVIDHITAGRGMRLYELLGLDKLDCSVAIIKNVKRFLMLKYYQLVWHLELIKL